MMDLTEGGLVMQRFIALLSRGDIQGLTARAIGKKIGVKGHTASKTIRVAAEAGLIDVKRVREYNDVFYTITKK